VVPLQDLVQHDAIEKAAEPDPEEDSSPSQASMSIV
jgi:hypothetical protein